MRVMLAAILMPILVAGCATTARLPSPAGTDLAVAGAMQQKMRAITFPELMLDDATIFEAVAFLKRRMQELDPAGMGISVLVILESRREPHPYPPSPGAAQEEQRVSLHLRNVTLEEAVERLCLTTDLRWTLGPKLTIGSARLLREEKK